MDKCIGRNIWCESTSFFYFTKFLPSLFLICRYRPIVLRFMPYSMTNLTKSNPLFIDCMVFLQSIILNLIIIETLNLYKLNINKDGLYGQIALSSKLCNQICSLGFCGVVTILKQYVN